MSAHVLDQNVLFTDGNHGGQDLLFESIASDLLQKGFSINHNALPIGLAEILLQQAQSLSPQQLTPASTGRKQQRTLNTFVRSDNICWIEGESSAEAEWLVWAEQLQVFLNRRLFLGLFSFESHFAQYEPGDFYKKHFDAFKADPLDKQAQQLTNLVLSIVFYLNPGWLPTDGGELLMYTGDDKQEEVKITPSFNTLVAFLSEEFPHEVLKTQRTRNSIAGWYRVNCSRLDRVDPPL